jgi:NAD(P)-dependent dehydrogenase (short-subunit alcohol dehydrogenase family)
MPSANALRFIASTKAAIALWPKILVGEFQMKGISNIRCVAIAPGYVGTPMDLVATAQFLGLEPVDGSEMNANDDSAVMELQDGRGGYATLQPVDRASDLLHTVQEMTAMMRSGDLPDELKRMLRENGIDLPEGNPWD